MAYDLSWPYPEYDLRATERWLERKAAKGRVLCSGENLAGFAAFEKAEPQAIRYRLVPAEKTNLFTALHKPPSAEALEIYRQMGWEYITNRGCFHIFASTDPNAPEPDTDPQILAMALKPARNRAILEAAVWLLTAVIWTFGLQVFSNAVRTNDPIYLLPPIPYLILALSSLGSCIRLMRYRRACAKGQFPVTESRIFLTYPVKMLLILTVVFLVLAGVGNRPNTPMSEIYDDYVLHEGYEWPFTIPGAEVTKSDAVSYRTFATRENWGYDGYIVMPDGSQGAIYIDYADFHSGLLARLYALELEHRTSNLIVHQGTEVYRIYTSVTIEDPEAVFFPERSEHHD